MMTDNCPSNFFLLTENYLSPLFSRMSSRMETKDKSKYALCHYYRACVVFFCLLLCTDSNFGLI